VKRQRGFSLFELIVVVTLIGVLAAMSIQYYNNAADDSRRVSIEALAHNFTTSVVSVHAQWLLRGDSQAKAATVGLDGSELVVNQYGWPVNAKSEAYRRAASPYRGSQAQENCAGLWVNLLQNPSPYVLEGDENDKGVRYRISVPEVGICRYSLSTRAGVAHYFDYVSRNGQVFLSHPQG
jgi:prepilin-type N-terminal cleavage/methylation domain-containing protein